MADLEALAARIERTFDAMTPAGGPWAVMCAMSDGVKALGFDDLADARAKGMGPREIAAALRARA